MVRVSESAKPRTHARARTCRQRALAMVSVWRWGVQRATEPSWAITARRRHSAPPRAMKRSISKVQPGMGIRWLLERKLASELGTMTEIQQMSMADRLGRKKHVGVWRQQSLRVMSAMVVCPACWGDKVRDSNESKREDLQFGQIPKAQDHGVGA